MVTPMPGRRPKKGEEGFALATALLCLFLLAVGLALVGESLALRMRLVQQESKAVTLSALSDVKYPGPVHHIDAR